MRPACSSQDVPTTINPTRNSGAAGIASTFREEEQWHKLKELAMALMAFGEIAKRAGYRGGGVLAQRTLEHPV